MINRADSLDLRPSLIGTITASATAVGAPIDTQGFSSVLAILVAGAGYGTGANAATLTVKIQESASATGTGTAWTDITNGTVNGSFKFSDISFTDITDPNLRMGKKFEVLSDGVRARYIRFHASLAGTAGSSPKICGAFLLGDAIDSIAYILNGATQATGNSEYTIGR